MFPAGLRPSTRKLCCCCVVEWKEIVWRSDYDKKQVMWLTMPITMTQKVAEVHCLRKAFTVSGVYSPDEMPEPDESRVMKEVPVNIAPDISAIPAATELTDPSDILTLDTIQVYRNRPLKFVLEEAVKAAMDKVKLEAGKWDKTVLDNELLNYRLEHAETTAMGV